MKKRLKSNFRYGALHIYFFVSGKGLGARNFFSFSRISLLLPELPKVVFALTPVTKFLRG